MRVFLDEYVPQAPRKLLSHHDTVTAAYAGYAGLKNGVLPRAVIADGFDALVTADKSLQYEQNLTGLSIAIVSLPANAWRLVLRNIPLIVSAVDAATPGSIPQVEFETFGRRQGKPRRSV